MKKAEEKEKRMKERRRRRRQIGQMKQVGYMRQERQIGYMRQMGSATVEATLIMPLFIVAMVSVYCSLQCKLAETVVYEAAMETAEYVAESTYLYTCNVAIPAMKFPSYVDDEALLDKYVVGGVGGVAFWGSNMKNEKQEVELKVSYQLRNPFLPGIGDAEKSFTIVRRAYVGDVYTEEDAQTEEQENYVYVTDNQEVYHATRACTYLTLSIEITKFDIATRAGFTPCEYCGENPGELVYITEQGQRYHSRTNCTGLKRTIYRRKKSEVQHLAPCSRCM